ncbi:hypothetical protein KW782_03360 [Candidatus Parcubacteria bacterium]|nr:hypothetical protein [Candidatus Parcubacteria bacterium]
MFYVAPAPREVLEPELHDELSRLPDGSAIKKESHRLTLIYLLEGRSERQIALSMQEGQHTVHYRIKWLYEKFKAEGRLALLSVVFIRALVARGLYLVSPSVQEELLRLPDGSALRAQQTRTTLLYLLCGMRIKEIAKAMDREPETIHTHIKRLHKMFDVESNPDMLFMIFSRAIKASSKHTISSMVVAMEQVA